HSYRTEHCFFNFSSPHPSLFTLMPIIGTSLIIAYCTKEDLVGKALSSKIFVAIGLISYSLYLWHFPIFSFYLHETPNLSNFDKSAGIVLATVLSVVSYKFIEKPFRKKSFIRSQFFYVIIAIFWGTLIFVNYNFISQKGYLERLPPILAKQNLDEKQWKQLKQNGVQCHNRLNNFCIEISDLNRTTVYSLGDSHLSALSPQLWSVLHSLVRCRLCER
ncbi:acyltransferase, partial [bacterium]|nr:acyltransferase [bacterium]